MGSVALEAIAEVSASTGGQDEYRKDSERSGFNPNYVFSS
jgi:hypothetical protein